MTTHLPLPAARRTPAAVVVARIALVVQTLIGYTTCAMLGFLALLAFAWQIGDDETGVSAAAVGIVAAALFAVAVTVSITVYTARLRAGAESVRIALLRLQVVVIGTMLAMAAWESGWGLRELVLAPAVYVACGLITIVALATPNARDWSAARR